jgi:two-component system OmpR family response regulator
LERILVVDDDAHIRAVVRFALEKSGFAIDEAADGRAALEAFDAREPDLVVLDVLMPELDGLDVCRSLRARSERPILMLSSRDDTVDRIVGIELGADDYMVKPFSPRELVARVRGILRRAASGTSNASRAARESEAPAPIRVGALELDPARHRCLWRGQDVPLTATEFGLLRSLCGMLGRVYSRDELVDRAYGSGHHITDRTIDSHVRRIREKFRACGGDPVETVHGVGYRLRAECTD